MNLFCINRFFLLNKRIKDPIAQQEFPPYDEYLLFVAECLTINQFGSLPNTIVPTTIHSSVGLSLERRHTAILSLSDETM